METVLSIHDGMRKFRPLGANKQVSSSSICKYNLLRKADALLESLYRRGKVSRLLRVLQLKYRKYTLYRTN